MSPLNGHNKGPYKLSLVQEINPDVLGVRKKFLMTNLTMPDNISSMKYSINSVPGLADVGVPHGDGGGPRTPPRCMGRVWKKV